MACDIKSIVFEVQGQDNITIKWLWEQNDSTSDIVKELCDELCKRTRCADADQLQFADTDALVVPLSKVVDKVKTGKADMVSTVVDGKLQLQLRVNATTQKAKRSRAASRKGGASSERSKTLVVQ